MNKSKAETMESPQLTAPEGALEDARRAAIGVEKSLSTLPSLRTGRAVFPHTLSSRQFPHRD